MAGRLEGKIVVITGSGGPVGRAIALRFAREGARIVGADLDAEADAATVAAIGEAGAAMRSTGGRDLTQTADCEAVVECALENFGRIDVLVNNASCVRFAKLAEMTDDQWDVTIAGELTHVFKMTRAAWPALINSRGVVVNMSSTSALIGSRMLGAVAHSAAKAGVIGMTRQMAAEGAEHGIRVNAISPSAIETPMFKQAFPTPEAVKAVTGHIPRGVPATMDEIAGVVLFLASDDSAHITGTNLVADGGETAL